MGSLESDTTKWLHFHFSLSCIGEGNGNPLQCSCLENPRDGEAWWAAVCGVAQSRTQLKQLSSSSNYIIQTPPWIVVHKIYRGLPGGSDDRESACNTGDLGSIPGLGRSPWRMQWLPTPVFLPGEFHGQRSLAGYSSWGRKVEHNWVTHVSP